MRITISTKLITITVLILLLATIPIAIKSSKLFEETSLRREEETNLIQAISYSKIVTQVLQSKTNSLESVGSILLNLTKNNAPLENNSELEINFQKDKNLVSIDLYKVQDGKFSLLHRKIKTSYLEKHKLTPDYFQKLRTQKYFPYRNVAKGSVEVRNSTQKNSPALFTIGIPVAETQGQISHIAVADYELSVLQNIFTEKSERTLFLVDRTGLVIAHQDEEKAINESKMNQYPPVYKALTEETPKKQIRFLNPENNQYYQGAYAKTPFGVTVIAQSSEDVILEPSRLVRREAFFITGMVVSGAIFLIFLFSMSLTGPIEKLADLIKLVSKGQFDIHARKHVRSRDEVGDLAIAFDNMTEGLKERDKVKNLFNKFHGSTITEDLLKNDIGVGGSNKEVTVFFSDVRGFTAFSENHTPEEVVTMLNEYFSEMVSIINKYNGVVDKFIGDAIMAVWGAPHTTPNDAKNAVRAAIEMRKALDKLNTKRLSRGHSPLMIGMGLHSGRAISGTIGSSERMEYTVIGDTVNMASRIEASTKSFGVDLLISQETCLKVGADFLVETAGFAEVKGKSEALQLFKVNGYINEKGEPVTIQTPYSDYEKEKSDKVKVAA